jgi:hypothetical protein
VSDIPPPSRYLDGPDRPGMFPTWSEALAALTAWAVLSVAIVGTVIGLGWLALHLVT